MFIIHCNVKKQAQRNIICVSQLLHVCCLFSVLSLMDLVVW